MNTISNLPRIAADINVNWHSQHRGVMVRRGGRCIVFGNDGYLLDGRSRRQVVLLLAALGRAGIAHGGMATDPNGYTWVLVVESADADRLNEMVWKAWMTACRQATGRRRAGD